MIRRMLLISAAAIAIEIAALPAPQAHADLPVIDAAGLAQAWQMVQQGIQTVGFLKQQLTAMMDVPRELIGQMTSLLDLGVSNPLQDILGNLTVLQNGYGTGTCTGGQNLLGLNQYAAAIPVLGGRGMDFMGASLNGSAARGAGLLACTNQMMQATQTRLSRMPEILDQLKGCADLTCEQGVSGRIAFEQAQIAAQTQQAILVGQAAQMQRWTAEDQAMQKMRSDAQAEVQATGGGGAIGADTSSMISSDAPVFNAATAGVGG